MLNDIRGLLFGRLGQPSPRVSETSIVGTPLTLAAARTPASGRPSCINGKKAIGGLHASSAEPPKREGRVESNSATGDY